MSFLLAGVVVSLYVPLRIVIDNSKDGHLGSPGLDWIRRRQRALAKGVLALFCLVWLQAALLPCAMALSADGMAAGAEEHCVYCPPGVDHAEHCEPAPETHCQFPDSAQADTRPLAAGFVVPPLATSFVFKIAVAADPPAARESALAPAVPRPPYAVTYCRYLK